MGFTDNILLNCKQATLLYDKKKEGQLSKSQSAGLWFHMLVCKVCRLFVTQSDFIEHTCKHKAASHTIFAILGATRRQSIKQALVKEMNK